MRGGGEFGQKHVVVLHIGLEHAVGVNIGLEHVVRE